MDAARAQWTARIAPERLRALTGLACSGSGFTVAGVGGGCTLESPVGVRLRCGTGEGGRGGLSDMRERAVADFAGEAISQAKS